MQRLFAMTTAHALENSFKSVLITEIRSVAALFRTISWNCLVSVSKLKMRETTTYSTSSWQEGEEIPK